MKAAAAAVIAPSALVLLMGAAIGSSPPSAESSSPGSTTVLIPARPFTGGSPGCTVPDPTGTGGCVTPATAWLLDELARVFGPLPTSCWDEHAWNPASDHPRGRGCDVTFGQLGEFPDPLDVDHGWSIARWLQTNAASLRVKYLIWQGRIWHAARVEDGWLVYSGGGVYDPSSPTGGHYDHIHISTTT